ncbi:MULTISPECIES: anaerobic sulfatase-maturation protein [unclassified Prevotella]|uniref:anaerobic sulfatase-maturation protein n=1 Tax=unclassified Prevotella TaxID=2638335 RepID=UPI00051311E3|nr:MULTISPECIES: anaerobic sulfatase-maturation protein [unclassified Prevotella]KGI60330.1 anaerobic sulfatase-maturase [Prevotella sp. S7 MS 2]
MTTISPFSRPLYVMLKPVGSHCNLACEYCYYLEKSKLYPDYSKQMMTDELLEKFTEEFIGAQTMNEVLFQWHGGEPLMRPLSFYKRALELQKKYAGGRKIDNVLQTNGTLLTDEWCKFLHDNNFLVGVSIDGPQEFHDEFRKSRSRKPSWAQVMKGIRLLNKWDVQWNAMAVVNEFNADYPLEFYRFFKEIGAHYIQFAPIVERLVKYPAPEKPNEPEAAKRHLAHMLDTNAPLADFSVSPKQWGRFLCTLFDEWVKQDVGEYFVQIFDATLANWVGEIPGVCTMAQRCGHAACMEFNGDVYSCDHFVFPEFKLGNIHEHSLVEMLYGERQQRFGDIKQQLPRRCMECEWKFACNGECPKNRFVKIAAGEPGLNYLCEGYKMFFNHVAPYMDFMKKEYENGRPPANVMKFRP